MPDTDQVLILKIRGMTCPSCEKRVETAIAAVPGVISVQADHSRGQATINFDPASLSADQLELSVAAAVRNAGYQPGKRHQPGEKSKLSVTLAIAGGLIVLFLIINAQGWFNFLPTIDSSISLAMIFVAGLLTSVHCVAMCGGIALSQQAKAPLRGLQYHAGRVVAYTLIGGLVGALGSVLTFSPQGKGILAGFAALFMVGIGLRMLGLLPRLTAFKMPRLSRWISPKFSSGLRQRGPFFVGLLNGLMPCGPLQTMQLYALGTGSALLGALSMFLFSLGTVPLLFAFGALSSFFTPKWQLRLVQASAVMVVFFGLVMAGRALDMSGASGMIRTAFDQVSGANNTTVGARNSLPSGGSATGGTNVATIKDGIQYVSFDLQANSYAPITVQKGLPVRWTINASPDSINGCNGELVVPQFNLRKKLEPGVNLIEFTPDSNGVINYTCWMGMIGSTIKVVEKIDQTTSSAPDTSPGEANIPAAVGGCCGASGATAFANGAIPTDRIAKASFSVENGQKIQLVTVKVDGQGYSPAVILLQKGVPARIKFEAAALDGCNSYVNFPDFDGGLDLSRGQLATPLLPTNRDFVFQCGMDMLHGYVRVVADLDKANLDETKSVVKAWQPARKESGSSQGMSCHAVPKDS